VYIYNRKIACVSYLPLGKAVLEGLDRVLDHLVAAVDARVDDGILRGERGHGSDLGTG